MPAFDHALVSSERVTREDDTLVCFNSFHVLNGAQASPGGQGTAKYLNKGVHSDERR
jgi:hypothetical protein